MNAAVVTDLEQLDRVVQALQAPVPVRHQAQVVVAERLPRLRRQQDLPAHCSGHDTRRGRLGHTLDLERLGAQRDVGGLFSRSVTAPTCSPARACSGGTSAPSARW